MKQSGTRRFGWLAGCGTLLAILACYGTLAVIGALSLMGVSLAINEGVWAGAIVVFALVALAGIFIGWRGHRVAGPLVLGVIGAGLVVWVMGVSYSRPIEIAGFIALVVAAVWDWRAKRAMTSPPESGAVNPELGEG
jgi:hypothetical protein